VKPLLVMDTHVPAGGSAAAYVPYTKKKKEWIVSSVVQYVPDTREYIVKDQFPDSRKKSNTYRVLESHVVAYPAGPEEVFSPSDDVLSLWLGDDAEWSSVFYRATVVTTIDKDELQLQFPPDIKIVSVPRSKVVKYPSQLSQTAEGEIKSTDAEMTGAATFKRDIDTTRAERETSKRPRGVSPDSAASSPDTTGSSPHSPGTQPAQLNSSSNGPSGSAADISDERTHGRGVLEKKLVKYQQLLAARKRTEALS